MTKKMKKIGAAAIALLTAGCLATTLIPAQSVMAAEKTTNIDGFSAAFVADPDTSEDSHIFNGTSAEDGKIWTDKSVTTGAIYGVTVGEENFGIALSALAQTYNTIETTVATEEKNVAYDVVFVLDFSASMVQNNVEQGKNRAEALVEALNPAIDTLMDANENNRIAVARFNGSGDINTNKADTLLELDHYTTNSADGVYFTYSNSNISVPRNTVQNSMGGYMNNIGANLADGTPTQRGIYHGMYGNPSDNDDDGMFSTATVTGDVIRIPVMVLLTDGEAGRASKDYKTLNTGNNYIVTGTAGNGSNNAGVGAYTILTANHIKKAMNDTYRANYDYTGIIKDGESVAKFYTIGLGISENSWTHFMLDPDQDNVAKNDNTANSIRNILKNDITVGSGYNSTTVTNDYKENYDYADAYYGGNMSTEELSNAFAEIVSGLKIDPQLTSTINNPITAKSELDGVVDPSDLVKFTDYLGYKMELKGDSVYVRYNGINYRFDKQNTDPVTYTFSNLNQQGESVTGPAIPVTVNGNTVTYGLKDVKIQVTRSNETVNGQTGYWVVNWEFPAALLPTYSRLNDYDNTDLDPIRLLFEVGLEADTDLMRDGLKTTSGGDLLPSTATEFDHYVFNSNLYRYETKADDGTVITDPEAMSWAEYSPSKGNPFYYETGYITDKVEAGYEESADVPEYIRLDLAATTTQRVSVTGTVDVTLNNIELSLDNSRATFEYNGVEHYIDLSGDNDDGAIWEGEVPITVTATTEDGKQIEVTVGVIIEAEYDENYGPDDLELTGVTIIGQDATITNGWYSDSATLNDLEVTRWETETETTDEIVPVYLELKQDSNGFYVETESGNGAKNRIDVTWDETEKLYEVELGETIYYSTTYYKYAETKLAYTEKNLPKGTVARSLVGQFIINQPTGQDFKLTETNFDDVFQYIASNGNAYRATTVTFSDGTDQLGNPADGGDANIRVLDGTLKVCIDGIQNGLYDVNGNPMTVHFEFDVEAQKQSDGTIKYVVLDVEYWEREDTYAVDIAISDTPEISEPSDSAADVKEIHTYNVSYTIESTHANAAVSGAANVTQTDPHFFHSHFDNGTITAHLGNNGRISVNTEDAYENAVTVEKQWHDRLGNELSGEDIAGFSITVGLYQQFAYENEEGRTITQTGPNGIPFDTVVLDSSNDFKYTWNTPSLPKYLVSDGGDYVLDYSESSEGKLVEVTYVVGEVSGVDGWTLSDTILDDNQDDGVDGFVLNNVPLTDFDPSVTKVWTMDGEPVNAPVGYKVKVELLANGEPVTGLEQLDTEHVVNATLVQVDGSQNARLSATFGGEDLGSIDVTAEDFAGGKETVNKVFTYDNAIGGEVGSGTHADSADITITISKTSGDKYGISDATITYHFIKIGTTETDEVTLHTYRTSDSQVDDTKKASFLMYYTNTRAAVVELDGTEEPTPWSYTWADWNLPLLDKDETTGLYVPIVYSVRETLLVPDSSAEGGYAEYAVSGNGLIYDETNDKVFKATITHTEDYQFTITNDESNTSIEATKVWSDNDNKYDTRPDSITFTLMADGEVADISNASQTFTSANADEWNGSKTVKWDNLDIYNVNGDDIVYTIEETMEWSVSGNDQYQTIVTVDPQNEDHYIVTNSLYADPAINSTFVEVDKTWVDDNDAEGKRPDVLFMVLYRAVDPDAGEPAYEPIDYVTLTDSKLEDVFADLPKYNEDGKKYLYEVREFTSLARTTDNIGGVEGYIQSVSVGDVVFGGDTGYSFSFTNQLENGETEKVVIKEWKVPGGFALPESVTVELKAVTTDGQSVDLTSIFHGPTQTYIDYKPVQTLTADAWSYTWSMLPEYFDGMKVDYTVIETKVGDTTVSGNDAGDYIVSVQDDGTDGVFVVTNTITGETSISVEKEWENAPVGFEIPEVTFEIFGEYGQKMDETLTVNSENKSDTVTGLPKYNADGQIMQYTLKESVSDDDYNKAYTSDLELEVKEGTNGFEFTAINHYVELLADIEGSKTWHGVTGDNIPESITIALYRQVEGGEKELVKDSSGNALQPVWTKKNEEGQWTYVYEDMPVYAENTSEEQDERIQYIYTVEEIAVDGITVSGNNAGDYTVEYINDLDIANRLGGTVSGSGIDGTKTWVSVSGNDNIPEKITVELWRSSAEVELQPAFDVNDDPVEAITVERGTQGTVWTFDFGDNILPKYDPYGNEWVYSVKESSVTSKGTTQVVEYGDNTDTTGVVGDYTVTVSGSDIINTLNGGKTSYTVTKEWVYESGYTIPSEGIEVKLTGSASGFNDVVVRTAWIKPENAITGNKNVWQYTFSDIPKYAPDGITEYVYSVEETKIATDANTVVSVSGNMAGDWAVDVNNNIITNSHDPVTKDIVVTKIWKDESENILSGDNLPESVIVQLYQDGIAFRVSDPIIAPDWTYIFEDVPASFDGVHPITYTVKEISVTTADGIAHDVVNDIVGDYSVTVSGNDIINQKQGGTTTYPVTKNWVDTTDIPDSITIQLLQDGEEVPNSMVAGEVDGIVELTASNASTSDANEWNYTFTGLPKYRPDGITEYVYTAKEIAIEDISVDETTFKAGSYSVSYEQQDAQQTIINNDQEDDFVEFTVEKIWLDKEGNALAVDRQPDSITVQLYQQTEEGGEKTPVEEPVMIFPDGDGSWSFTYVGLQKYQPDGLAKYIYSVEEIKVNDLIVSGNEVGDYDVTVSGNEITNKLNENSPALTSVTIEKLWKDQYGNDLATDSQPDSITVQLYQGDTVYDECTFSANSEGKWLYEITGLPVYEADGVTPHSYRVEEVSITKGGQTVYVDRSSGIAGSYIVEENGLTITNTLDNAYNEFVEYQVTKTWAVSAGTVIPEEITLRLLQDGEPYEAEVQLVKGTPETTGYTWTHTFVDLPKYRPDGVTEYEYSVTEVKVGGTLAIENTDGTLMAGDYTITVSGNEVINTLNQEKTSYTITKIWDGVAEKNLPENISVQLLQNGVHYGNEVVLTKDNVTVDNNGTTWTYTFNDLPMRDANNIDYVYSVEESRVGGIEVDANDKAGDYLVSVSGNDITNTLTGTVGEIAGKKVWMDAAKVDERPESITVGLYRESADVARELVGTQTIEGDGWDFSFANGYPKYDTNGNLYTYSVRELNEANNPVEDNNLVTFGSNEYRVVYGQDPEGEYTIKNTLEDWYDPADGTPIKVTKIWKDDNDSQGKRPDSITVYLKQNGIKVDSDVLTLTGSVAGNETNPTVTSDEESVLSNESDNSVTQDTVSDSNTVVDSEPDNNVVPDSVSGNDVVPDSVSGGDAVQNSEPDNNVVQNSEPDNNAVQNSVSDNNVTQNSESENTPAPNNGTEDISTLDLRTGTVENTWTGKFADKYPMYDAEGALIDYQVVEEPVPTDYVLSSVSGNAAEGFTLTNTYAPGQTTVTVTKIWVDNNDALGIRPDSITLKLLQNGAEFSLSNVVLNESNGWTVTVNVPLADENGVLYTYTVDEPDAILVGTDYVKTVSGNDVTNTLQKTIVVIGGTKGWSNINEENRPASITLELWRKAGSAEAVQVPNATVTTDASKDWKYAFDNGGAGYPKYDENGALYTYIVKETKIGDVLIEDTDYVSPTTVSVSGGDYSSLTLTNALKPVLVSVNGTKTWADNNNQHGLRPASITVNLLRDGVKIDSVNVTAAQDGTWTYEFSNLPKYDMSTGKQYVYAVTEEPVANYQTTVNGYDITNTVIPPQTPVDPTPEPEPDKASFTLTGTKILNGGTMTEGQFKFLVYNEEGILAGSGTNTADGKIVFTTMTTSKVGKEVLTIVEEKGDDVNITYDSRKIQVTVEVGYVYGELKATVHYPEGGIVFTNTYAGYNDGEAPKTGDDSPIMLLLAALLVCGGGLGGLLVWRKKKEQEN